MWYIVARLRRSPAGGAGHPAGGVLAALGQRRALGMMNPASSLRTLLAENRQNSVIIVQSLRTLVLAARATGSPVTTLSNRRSCAILQGRSIKRLLDALLPSCRRCVRPLPSSSSTDAPSREAAMLARLATQDGPFIATCRVIAAARLNGSYWPNADAVTLNAHPAAALHRRAVAGRTAPSPTPPGTNTPSGGRRRRTPT